MFTDHDALTMTQNEDAKRYYRRFKQRRFGWIKWVILTFILTALFIWLYIFTTFNSLELAHSVDAEITNPELFRYDQKLEVLFSQYCNDNPKCERCSEKYINNHKVMCE